MQTIHRMLVALLMMGLAVAPVFPQDTDWSNTGRKLKSDATHQEPLSDGLRKIVTRTTQNWNFDTPIHHPEFETNIEAAVEHALKSVEVALEKLSVQIDPLEINLKDLNVDIDPIVVNIPNLKIDIEPVEVDLDQALDIDTDFHHRHFDADDENRDDHDKVRSKDTSPSTSNDEEKKEKKKSTEKVDKKENEKSKGLKKLN